MIGWLAHVGALRAHFEGQVGSLGAQCGAQIGPKRVLGGGLMALGGVLVPSGPQDRFETPLEQIRPQVLGPLGPQVGPMLGPRWLSRGVEIRYQNQHAT